jgi:hypothetical protein
MEYKDSVEYLNVKAKEANSSTGQGFTSLERRLDSMQTRFDDLSGRIGNIELLLHRLASSNGSV